MRKVILIGVLTGLLAAQAADLKVYIFAGQSNMAGNITKLQLGTYDTAMRTWADDANNPVLYHYWSSDTDKSTNWVGLDAEAYGLDTVVGYRLWNYWQAVDTNINVAMIVVHKGSTSLAGYWNAGGRDRQPHYSTAGTMNQGDGYINLTNQITTALGQLDTAGTPYDVEAFVWYQGEGDSSASGKSEAYRMLFEDLAHGWTNRSPVEFPNDNATLYGGSIRDICGVTGNLPTFAARISWQIKGSVAWGARSNWEHNLINVRSALVDYTQDHPDCGWIDVDDIPLEDYYHYDGPEQAEIGDRFAMKILDTLYRDSGDPRTVITEPLTKNADIPVLQSTISCSGVAVDSSNQPIGTLEWISNADGPFGSAAEATLSASGWRTNVMSYGAAVDNPDYTFTTTMVKKVEFKATLPSGLVLADQIWLTKTPDGDSDGLPDDWETQYYGSATAANTHAMASNGVNSVLDAYIAGIDPTDADARFNVNSLTAVSSDRYVLRWDGLSGRRYCVYWTTNLVTGFGAPIVTNIPWDETVFTNQNSNEVGFYRVEVEFE